MCQEVVSVYKDLSRPTMMLFTRWLIWFSVVWCCSLESWVTLLSYRPMLQNAVSEVQEKNAIQNACLTLWRVQKVELCYVGGVFSIWLWQGGTIRKFIYANLKRLQNGMFSCQNQLRDGNRMKDVIIQKDNALSQTTTRTTTWFWR